MEIQLVAVAIIYLAIIVAGIVAIAWMAVDIIRTIMRDRRETAAYAARKAAPEAVAARIAASDAWNAVNASRGADGRATDAAMAAWNVARSNCIRLGAW